MLKHSLLGALISVALTFAMLRVLPDPPAQAPAETPQPEAAVSFPLPESLRVLRGDQVVAMPLEDYVAGAAAGEMPASFAPEALKAQAVAARTYALYCMRTRRHADADVCTDYRCCQAWSDSPAEPVCDAVRATAGELLCYDGQAAFTAFHASSAGRTEDCGAIWGELPYLVSVFSPEDEQTVPGFVSRVEQSPLDLRDTLLSECPDADFTGDPADWLGEVELDRSGRVAAMTLGGARFTGTQLRRLFSLRSTAFTLDYDDGVFHFTVSGHGHGVGMSQYGAQLMALEGAEYREILAHYYPGTELVQGA